MSIILKNLSLDFSIYSARGMSLRSSLTDRVGGQFRGGKSSVQVVRALNNISLELKEGDRVGLIGHNGAGKSTLLRVLAGIYPPTSGEMSIDGRVASLFGTTLTSSQDMTGYENLFLNSLIFSRDYKFTKASMDEMAEFTELGEYLSLPMSTYSEGMKVRVGFASATNFVPDILLIDEVFGTGDKHFAEKSNKRISSLITESKIMLLASHSDGLISQFCNKALYLAHGEVKDFGDADKVISTYNKCL